MSQQRINQYVPPTPDAPAQDAFTITPSNTVNENQTFRGIYVGGAGDISVYTLAGNSVLFKNVPLGSILPISGYRVNLSATTATYMVGLV